MGQLGVRLLLDLSGARTSAIGVGSLPAPSLKGPRECNSSKRHSILVKCRSRNVHLLPPIACLPLTADSAPSLLSFLLYQSPQNIANFPKFQNQKSYSNMHTKGPAPQFHDGSNLRIGIVHARWNSTIIEPLLEGAKAKLAECGVKESNIVVQTVPGAWELPTAVQRSVLQYPKAFPSRPISSVVILLTAFSAGFLFLFKNKQTVCRFSSSIIVGRERRFCRRSAGQLNC